MQRKSLPATSFPIVVTLGLMALLIAAAPAWALRQRTFVAPDPLGNDANAAVDCTLAQPCRTFNVAIPHTTPGGEVVILDTAGYGPMTIDRSIKIIGPSGVYGGISVQGGGGPTTGIVINAGDTDVVTLRGLDIAGVPGGAPLPLYGIDIQNAGVVHIEKLSISNLTQDASICILVNSNKPISVVVNDSILRECRTGAYFRGTGPDDTTKVNAVIERTRFEHMINTGGGGMIAIAFFDGVNATVRDSTIALSGGGILMQNTIPAVHPLIHVIGTQITRVGTALDTSGPGPLQLHVQNSWISENLRGLLHHNGVVTLAHTVVINNGHGLVDCGGGAANVYSFGYDLAAGTGSNPVFANADPGAAGAGAGCTAYIVPTIFTGK